MPQAKASLGEVMAVGAPFTQDLPLVRKVDPGEHVHQGGFAAAVLPQQERISTAPNLQGDIVVGHHLAEPLGNMPQFDGRGTFQINHPFF